MRPIFWIWALVALVTTSPAQAAGLLLERQPGTVRIATFNADMARKGAGVLIKDIAERQPQILAVAEIVLRVRPDILLINEIDHDPQGRALAAFAALLAKGVGGVEGLDYPHRFTAPVNTGVPSGFDLDGDGRRSGPRDALGYGRFPGQYGMGLLSGMPLGPVRTFQDFPWSKVPGAANPQRPDGTPYYSPAAWQALPLSSKSHWDVMVRLPDGGALHLLASHPTPPVFDGAEDRNGLRNAAEIGFWAAYIDGAGWMVDDAGQGGGLAPNAAFVVLGDLNADPEKGDGDRAAIGALTGHARVRDLRPESPGAAELGDAADTADWPEEKGPGNLRVDYVLPSTSLAVAGSGVFWPSRGDPLAALVAVERRSRASSDHRLVWVDIRLGDE